MGRHYSGDIDGKFWFGVQSSDDADFFGVEGVQPEELYYYFDESDMNKVNSGISECILELGEYKEKLDEFFEKHESYNNEMLMKEFDISMETIKRLLTWYARLELGQQIYKCLEDKGSCAFTAEY